MKRDLIEYLRIVTQASYCFTEEKLSKYGLVKGQAHLLVIIKDNDGCTQKELSELLNVKYSSMSERLDKLENMGYIQRTVDENNSKYKRIFITALGRSATTQCRKIEKNFDTYLYNGFTKKDMKQFENYMEKLMENIENI